MSIIILEKNMNEYYNLEFEDFKRVFEFGANYYLEPSKNTTGRTTGEPRGLGAILDAFTLGKLTEIGVEKILKTYNPKKDYILDFDIKSNNDVKDKPDIVAIVENNIKRKPNLFVEIKNTSDSGRWIGLTEEQFNTIKRSAKNREIYIIYASIISNAIDNNPKTTDLTGMFLKEIENQDKSQIFQKFSSLNAKCKIEFIISSKDLEKFAYPFERGMSMYETNLFKEKKKSSFYSRNEKIRKDILNIKEFINFDDIMNLTLPNNELAERDEISLFKIKGSFKILYKKSTTYIECISDVYLENEIFGKFKLEAGKFYSFNLTTVGRDPKLKRNNLFISKNRIYQLIEQDLIKEPNEIIKEIAEKI